MRRIVGFALVFAGCRCASQTPRDGPVVLPHYAEWETLIRQVALAEVGASSQVARDLTEGEASSWAGEGGEDGARAAGGALGFLQIATSVEDLAVGLPKAASGCAICHVGAGVQPTADRPAWAHETAAAWTAWGVVFSREDAPPGGGEGALRNATEALPKTSAESFGDLLSVCHGCHATGTPGSL